MIVSAFVDYRNTTNIAINSTKPSCRESNSKPRMKELDGANKVNPVFINALFLQLCSFLKTKWLARLFYKLKFPFIFCLDTKKKSCLFL